MKNKKQIILIVRQGQEWDPYGYYYGVYDAVAIGTNVRLQITPETDRYK